MRTLQYFINKNIKKINKKAKQQYRKFIKKQVRIEENEVNWNSYGYDNRVKFNHMVNNLINNCKKIEEEVIEIDSRYIKEVYNNWEENQKIFKGEERSFGMYYNIPNLIERFKNFKLIKDTVTNYDSCLAYRNWFIDTYFTKPLIDGLEKENPLLSIQMITDEALKILENNISFSRSTYIVGSNIIVGNSYTLNIRKPKRYLAVKEPAPGLNISSGYNLKKVEIDVEYVNRKQPELDKIEELLFSLKLDKVVPDKKEVVKKKKKI